MAITNAMIVLEQAIALAEAGKIGYTGEILTVEINGEEITMKEPEQIHTYARWKAMGYQVRRGEKAIAKFKVWKYAAAKKKADDDSEEKTASADRGKMFLKQAAFFSATQVEPIKGTA